VKSPDRLASADDLRDYAWVMTTAPNPYAADLGTRDALDALSDTPQRIRAIVETWSDNDFERSYAAGKWSIRKVLIHLTQTELALPTRVRFALAQVGYIAQSFAQDDWMPIDETADARTALDAYTALRRFNLAMFRNLTPEQRAQLEELSGQLPKPSSAPEALPRIRCNAPLTYTLRRLLSVGGLWPGTQAGEAAAQEGLDDLRAGVRQRHAGDAR